MSRSDRRWCQQSLLFYLLLNRNEFVCWTVERSHRVIPNTLLNSRYIEQLPFFFRSNGWSLPIDIFSSSPSDFCVQYPTRQMTTDHLESSLKWLMDSTHSAQREPKTNWVNGVERMEFCNQIIWPQASGRLDLSCKPDRTLVTVHPNWAKIQIVLLKNLMEKKKPLMDF